MAITDSDIRWRYSVKAGSAGDSSAQADPNASIGRYMSTTEWTAGVLNDLFSDITGTQNLALASDYRCIFVYNSHATLTLMNAAIWIPAQAVGGADILIGLDTTTKRQHGASSVQALEVSDSSVAPTGVSFSAAATLGAALALSDLAPGECKAVWVKRTATNSGTLSNDSVTFRISGETLP